MVKLGVEFANRMPKPERGRKMNNTRIGAMAGNSSPSKLAPETIKIRNALIEKYADQPIEELNNFLQHALEVEKDELKRLGLLAARVYILRQKVLSLKAFIRDERLESLPIPNLALTEQILLDETANSDIDTNSENTATVEWHSLQMIEPGEVNGVRFFQGTLINAKAEDAEKLISSGKAVVVDDKGNPVEDNAIDSSDNKDNSDAPDSNAEADDKVTADDATDSGIASNDENTGDPDSTDAIDSSDNKDNSDTPDSNAEAVDEVTADDATDSGIASNDENSGDPDSADATQDTVQESGENKDAADREGTTV
jgi:hypothetical protein